MPNNKKHHYVPRFYLKRFSKDGKTICLFNLKKSKKIISANLQNQCYQNYFYGKKLNFEYELSRLELEVANILRHIDQDKMLPFSVPASSEYILLILFLLTQYGRTKYATEALNEITDKITKHILRLNAEKKDIDLSKVKIGIKDVAHFSTSTVAKCYPVILDLHCKLLINDTNVEFITSDNPMVLYNQFMSFQEHTSNIGLLSKGLQIFFPIDPKKLILLYDSKVYRVGNDRKNTIEIINPTDIHHINKLQVCSCLENIYFCDPNFDAESLYKRAFSYLRTTKSNVIFSPEFKDGDDKSELFSVSPVGIRTNLKLTFLTIRKSAKKWRDEFIKQKIQPAVVVRNRQTVEDFDEFVEAVKKGEYKPADFFEFIENKYSN